MKILTKELKKLERRDNGIETEVTKLKQMLEAMNETLRSNQDMMMNKVRNLTEKELVKIRNQTSVLKRENRKLLAENRIITHHLQIQNETLHEEIQQLKNKESDIRDKNRELSTENRLFREQLNDVKNTLIDMKSSVYEGRFNKIENSLKTFSTSINDTLDGLLEEHRILNLQVMNVSSSLSAVKSNLYPRNCYNILEQNKRLKGKDGVYEISINFDITSVFCDMTTDGGGWTVIQKRIDGSTDFYRTWEEYKQGFGDPKNNYWIGNDAIHALTKDQDQELRVDLQRFNGETAYAEYSMFYIGNEADKYRLAVSGYTGTAGDSLDYHNDKKFTTKDQNNDVRFSNCAVSNHGAWWYYICYHSNLNGLYAQSGVSGTKYPVWKDWKGNESLKQTMMMIRQKN